MVVLALVVLHLPPVRQRALSWVTAWLARELGLSLQTSDFRYNLLTATASLADASV